MLRRLIKYDMRSIAKIAVPILVASGVISLLCCAILYFTFGFADHINSIFKAFMITGGLYLIGVATILVMLSIVVFAIISRYYRSIFTDEGYLNMVIPVTRRNLLNSKIISSTAWFLIAGATGWLCVVISLVLPILLYDTSLFSVAIDAIKLEIGVMENDAALALTAVVLKAFLAVAGVVKDVMVIITALTLGATLLKQFKIACSVALYFVIVFVEELFVDVVEHFVRKITVNHSWLTLIFNTLFELVIIACVYAFAYFISLYMLEKKFDLQ